MAYLMKHEHMTLLEAFHLVREKRPFVRPNNGFWLQLIEYEKELKGYNTVTMEKCGSGKYRPLNSFFILFYSTF